MRARLCMLLLFLTLMAGCAINDRGLAKVDRFENDYGYVVRTRVWGLHIVTVAADEGMTIGYSDRAYFIPKSRGRDCDSSGGAIAAAPWKTMSREQGSEIRLGQIRAPVVTATFDGGVGIRFGAERAGVMLGFNSNARVRLSGNGAAEMAVRFDSQDFDALRFFYRENNP